MAPHFNYFNSQNSIEEKVTTNETSKMSFYNFTISNCHSMMTLIPQLTHQYFPMTTTNASSCSLPTLTLPIISKKPQVVSMGLSIGIANLACWLRVNLGCHWRLGKRLVFLVSSGLSVSLMRCFLLIDTTTLYHYFQCY